MAELTIEKASKQVKDLFNKGFTAFERGNLDYAIDLFFSCIEQEPRLLRARKFLRAAEVQRFKLKKSSIFSRGMASLSGAPAMFNAKAIAMSKNSDKALIAAEKLLKNDPLNTKYMKIFSEAAVAANLPEAAIQTLEVGREHYPDDIALLNWLGSLYAATGNTRGARGCFERVCELAPNDPDAVKQLKDAMAIDSMSTDGWDDAESYQDLIKDKEEASVLERESKAVKSDSDVEVLIREMESKIAAEPGNVNYYRAIARLYSQQHDFDSAISYIEKALAINPGDPELDSSLSKTKVQKYDYRIEQLRRAGDEQQAAQLDVEKIHFVFNDIQDRVARYPNDLELRFLWGVQLFDNDHTNEAVHQFQLSQRNPKRRVKSLYYLAMCFKSKGQYDMAKLQLETAVSEILTMTEDKMDVMYELGALAEIAGDKAAAANYYKQIYQVDIGYKDIAQKIEGIYQ